MATKNILIATGIYPPQIGGPAEYAKNLEDTWRNDGYIVTVKYFSFENKLPTGFRHLYFLLKSVFAVLKSDFILLLDTFSVALPIAILSKIFRKEYVIRIGGDFLWESYVERTKKKTLLKNFYAGEYINFNIKEKLIFNITKSILNRAKCIIFSTEWQRNIWMNPYSIDVTKTKIIENYYGKHTMSKYPKSKVFIGATRNLVWKNQDILKSIFEDRGIIETGATLDLSTSDRNDFINRISESYAVILVSLGDISPNMILDSIALNKPFIVTKELGIADRIKDIAILVDPLNADDIKEKTLWLLDEKNYNNQINKIANFNFTHSWSDIADEIIKND